MITKALISKLHEKTQAYLNKRSAHLPTPFEVVVLNDFLDATLQGKLTELNQLTVLLHLEYALCYAKEKETKKIKADLTAVLPSDETKEPETWVRNKQATFLLDESLLSQVKKLGYCDLAHYQKSVINWLQSQSSVEFGDSDCLWELFKHVKSTTKDPLRLEEPSLSKAIDTAVTDYKKNRPLISRVKSFFWDEGTSRIQQTQHILNDINDTTPDAAKNISQLALVVALFRSSSTHLTRLLADKIISGEFFCYKNDYEDAETIISRIRLVSDYVHKDYLTTNWHQFKEIDIERSTGHHILVRFCKIRAITAAIRDHAAQQQQLPLLLCLSTQYSRRLKETVSANQDSHDKSTKPDIEIQLPKWSSVRTLN